MSIYLFLNSSGQQPVATHHFRNWVPQTLRQRKQNAAIVMLVRGDAIYGEVLPALVNFERQFNSKFGYDYVLFSDEPEPSPYAMLQLQTVTNHKVRWSQLQSSDWSTPSHVDPEKLKFWTSPPDKDHRLPEDEWREISHTFGMNYRHMCRFWNTRVFDQPILQTYDWIWRIDPDIKFHCSIPESPIDLMAANDQLYGFAQMQWESPTVIKDLYQTVHRFFLDQHPEAFQPDSWKFVQDPNNASQYNTAAFYTNFEIVHRTVFQSSVWRDLWKHLEEGVYLYRWGDSPIHTLFISATMKPEQVAHISDSGYQHNDNTYICPPDPLRCTCNGNVTQDGLAVSKDNHAQWWDRAKQGNSKNTS